ncbi:MAG: hypothetical protein CMG04_09830 [Candidatus Marinimicrobia bacterium]|nr:hypothetical protein [Candidatus Neomarinimicrobiota bacterium]|tara:strand:+ start:1529 stop:1732 length:204 start_codon:yes stop_codon:yes gene_type:complete
MVILLSLIAIVFTFYAPFYLRRRKNKIKPTKNVFDKFVDEDHGYPWSLDKERKDSYRKALEKKVNED